MIARPETRRLAIEALKRQRDQYRTDRTLQKAIKSVQGHWVNEICDIDRRIETIRGLG